MANPTTTLQVLPQTKNVVVNQIFTIDVNVTDVIDFWAFDFKLGYDNSILNLTDDNLNQTMDDLWGIGRWNSPYNKTQRINNTIGVYRTAVTALYPASPFNGSTSLVTLWFKALSVGTRALGLYDTKLVNYTDLEAIAHSVINGTVNVSTSVGGIQIPIDKLAVLTLNIAPNLVLAIPVVLIAIYVKRKRH